jgi:hypothetical protein
MKGVIHFLIMLITVSFASHTAYATPHTYIANLTGANEVPPTGSQATGQGVVVLDVAAQTFQISITFSGLGTNTVAAHIHCCLPASFLNGVNVGVATTVPAFVGFPLGVTSGTYVSQVFDLTQAAIYNTTPVTGFVALQGGIPQAEAAFIAGIQNGRTYLNIHTVQFGGGEIRGFLTAVPEPGTLFLLASGLMGLYFARRKTRLS